MKGMPQDNRDATRDLVTCLCPVLRLACWKALHVFTRRAVQKHRPWRGCQPLLLRSSGACHIVDVVVVFVAGTVAVAWTSLRSRPDDHALALGNAANDVLVLCTTQSIRGVMRFATDTARGDIVE